ncbi:MAG: asparagine synthase (glutamine-hydrolyzing) [Verrucomicrobiales bacterium]
MCGIAGQFDYVHGTPARAEVIRRMADSIRHRGPDDEGCFVSGALGLGFRRLSIIDLGGGHQPMSDEAGSVWVIFNGEIYNFRELRSELEGHGHQFLTHSDTEVIVHGYKQWGIDVLNRLNGMFGLAIWDVNAERLVVARDAMGIKLVYYKDEGGQLTFGSEIRAIMAADPGRKPEIDPTAVNLFLRFRYTPSPLTIYKGIRKLAPGTMLVIEKGQCREKRWYDFTPEPFDPPKSDQDAEEELLQLYREAVDRHLISDVPVGILLSGGLDSGLLLGLMQECGPKGHRWPAYTVGYGSSFADDELSEAAETARLLGAEHIPVQLDRTEFEASLAQIVTCLEEPIASSSIIPMFKVCERARQDVKVVIVGQGPDELFGGYKRHLGVHYGETWRKLPAGLRRLAGAAIQRLPRNETAKRGVQSLAIENRLSRYQNVFSLAPAPAIRSLFQAGALSGHSDNSIVDYWASLEPQMAHLDELGGFQHLEIRSSLPDELLMFGDKITMAHGLEGRVPFLDRKVVEYAQCLDSTMKVRHGSRKWLHRKVCHRYLPSPILKRKKKGFAVNVTDGWFHDSLDSALPDMLLDSSSLMYGFLEPEPVKALLANHRSGRHDNHKLLFSLVMVEQCLREARH